MWMKHQQYANDNIFFIEFRNDKNAIDNVCVTITIHSDNINLCDNSMWLLTISSKFKQDAILRRYEVSFTLDLAI